MRKLYIIFGICLLVYCKYSPTGTNYNNISPSNLSEGVSINLDNEKDTLIVWDYTNLYITINSAGERLDEINVLLNDNIELEVLYQQDGRYRVKIQTSEYQDGAYRFTIYITLTSGTGSLADILHIEKKIVYKSWVMIIDNTEPAAIEIKNVFNENGRLKIEWDKYSNYNFHKYILHISNFVFGSYNIEILNQNATSWIDSNYVGGSLNCSVDLIAKDKVIKGVQKKINIPLPQITRINNNDQNISLEWEPCQFYSNFENYYLVLKYKYSVEKDTLITIDEVDKYTINIENQTFGVAYDLYLCVNTNGKYGYFNHQQVWIGNKISPYTKIEYNISNDSYYLSNRRNLIRLDPNTLDTLSFSSSDCIYYFNISEDGEYLYTCNGNCLARLNLFSFQLEKSYQISEIIEKYIAFIPTVVNDGLIFGECRKRAGQSWNYAGIGVIDVVSSERMYTEIVSPDEHDKFYISDNGLYILNGNKLYKIHLNAPNQYLGNFNYKYFKFFNMGEKFVYTCNQNITIYRTANLEVLNMYQFDEEITYPEIDPVSGHIGVIAENSSKYYVIDMSLNEIIFKQKIETRPNVQYDFKNNCILSSDGFCFDLPND